MHKVRLTADGPLNAYTTIARELAAHNDWQCNTMINNAVQRQQVTTVQWLTNAQVQSKVLISLVDQGSQDLSVYCYGHDPTTESK